MVDGEVGGQWSLCVLLCSMGSFMKKRQGKRFKK